MQQIWAEICNNNFNIQLNCQISCIVILNCIWPAIWCFFRNFSKFFSIEPVFCWLKSIMLTVSYWGTRLSDMICSAEHSNWASFSTLIFDAVAFKSRTTRRSWNLLWMKHLRSLSFILWSGLFLFSNVDAMPGQTWNIF